MKKLLTGPWFFILFTIACLIPFFILTAFNHPSADDFTVTYSLKVKGFWEAQINWYLKWSGRYISTAIVSLLHPLVYKSFFLYRLYPVLLLLTTLFSTNHLVKNLIPNLNKSNRLAISSILTISLISVLPSIVQGFYWVPGSLIYMLANIFTILFSSYLIQYDSSKKRTDLILFILFGILAIGSNELNLFIVLLITGLWVLAKLLINKRLALTPTITLFFFLFASLLSLLAPGNSARGSVIEKDHLNDGFKIHDVLFSISKSISHGFSDLYNWLFFSPLIIICLFVVIKHKDLRLKLNTVVHPILVWIAFVGLFFFLYFPYYFGTGNPDSSSFPLRTSNVICFYICFAMPIAIFYTLNWMQKRKKFELAYAKSPALLQVISIVFVVVVLASGNVKIALKDLRSRDFLAYNNALNARYEFIEKSTSDTLAVDSLHFFPRTIYMEDISGDPENWKNAPYADYFGKKLIYLKHPKDAE